jgi:hypothetical protein
MGIRNVSERLQQLKENDYDQKQKALCHFLSGNHAQDMGRWQTHRHKLEAVVENKEDATALTPDVAFAIVPALSTQ